MLGVILLIYGDFDYCFEYGEWVWSYKLKFKKSM